MDLNRWYTSFIIAIVLSIIWRGSDCCLLLHFDFLGLYVQLLLGHERFRNPLHSTFYLGYKLLKQYLPEKQK
jgi:hypothetical protein